MRGVIVAFVVLAVASSALAQPLSIAVQVRNPAPTLLDEWRRDPSVVRVLLTNTSSSSQEVVLGIVLTNTTTNQTVRTNNSHPCMPTFRLAPGEMRTIVGPDLICENALEIDAALRTSVLTAGAIPEGDYEFCVTVLRADDRRSELATTGLRCATSRVIWPEPPVLIRPLSSDPAQRCDQAILLQWQPLTPPPADGTVEYRVRVVGIFEGQLPRQALESATRTETVVDERTSATSYTIAPNNPVLVDLAQRRSPRCIGLAWQVEALNSRGNPIATRGGTRGKSDIGTFSIECPGSTTTSSCSAPMTLVAYYPHPGDTIPWLPPHLIVQWGPYCDDVIRMEYTVRVTTEGTPLGTNNRTLNWPRGPIEGQDLSGYSNAAERARLIIVNQWDAAGGSVAWNDRFRRGASYTWSVDATLTRREGRNERLYSLTSGAQTFSLGLRMPTDPSPADGATLTDGSGITLSWTIPAPEQLTYDPPDLVTLRGRSSTGMMFGAAVEFIRVTLARDTAFRDRVASRSWRIPATDLFRTNDLSARELFGRKNLSGLNLPAGTYYWRVEYADPADTARPYRRGPIWRFTIGGASPEECFALNPLVPEHRSTVTNPSDGRIVFSIRTNPEINLAALRSCRVRIWQMSGPNEDPATVRSRSPILDATVTPTGGSIPIREVSRSGSSVGYQLDFINGAGALYSFTATNGQTYLWECTLQFASDRIRSDGTACTITEKQCSGVFTFRVGECNDPCEAPESSNRTPFSGELRVGDVIRIGHFEAELTSVSGTPSNLSGEALVRLPWFGIRVRTRFSGISVNTDRQVYSGELRAVQASSSPLSEDLANQLGSTLGLSSDQLQAVHALASDVSRLVSSFTANQPVEMPVGFDRVIEGQRITVGIIGMVFQPTGARFNAVFVAPLPWLGPGQALGFGVRNVCFSPNGLGRSLDIYLASDLGYRPSDESWSFNFIAPREARGGLPADSGTYVRITCGGFDHLRIAAEVEFPRTWLVPSPDDGRSKVTLRFATRIRRTGDFIADATITPFSPAGAPGFVLSCERVTVDLSDRDNPAGIVFPPGYTGTTDNSWRGFFLGRLRMTLPEALQTFSSGPPMVEVTNLLIDGSGLTLDAQVTNVIRYPEGNFGSWGASIDTLGLRLVSSSLQRGWMSGQIKVPVSDSSLLYRAILRDTVGGIRFEFAIQPRAAINMPLWAASLQLEPSSWVRLEAGGSSGFVAQANFTGQITFGGTRDIPLSLGGIRFQDMHIQTHQTPYVSVGSWAFASPPHSILAPPEPDGGSSSSGGAQSAGGFPVSIREFTLTSGSRSEGPGVGVRIGVDVNLQGGGNGISGGTTITVWGAFQSRSDGPPSFVFSGIDLDSIGVRADLGAVDIRGSVVFYRNDPTYGSGFRGAVQATFVRMVEVSATVQFGSISGPPAYRYWYVDARALITSGIPVFSGVGIYGFGGGAWYNMRREGEPTSIAPTGSDERTTTASTGSAGSTNSGARYIPTYSPSGETFGCYASITIGTYPSPNAFNCDVRLEVQFVGGGIHEIRLRGDGWMMAGLLERASAPIRLTADISYNFPARTFHGDFGVSVRLEAVTATGRMVTHFAPDLWYIKIGDPEGERIAINVLNFIQLQAYFATGMNLPSLPPIPPEVLELTGPIPAPVRPEALGRGDGFLFGARADFAPPELRFLVFYASIRFLIGFDVALLNYGAMAQCTEGRPMGANGWYATGQMYARLDASIGLFVDLWFTSGKFEILGLRVGAALQAGLPNPTWIAGACGGEYSILGGAVRGYCNFRFTLGERCTPLTESALASLEMISDIAPDDGSRDISLFAEPTAFFNLEPDRPFALEEMRDDGSTVTKVFRIRVGSFTLSKLGGRSPQNVPGTTVNRSTREAPAVAFVPNQPLEPLTPYRAEVMAYGQEYTGSFTRRPGETVEQASQRAARELSSTTAWRDVQRRSGGGRIEQRVSTTFTTQALPDTIPHEWVYVAYPRPRQRFFLQDECREGQIWLFNNTAWLFPPRMSELARGTVADTHRLFRVRFINLQTGERVEVPLRYRATTRPGETSGQRGGEIQFTIPRLANGAIYAVQVIRRDSVVQRGSTSSGLNVRFRVASQELGDPRLSGTIHRRLFEREGSTLMIRRTYRPSGFDVARAVASNEKLLYVYFFRTSRYNRLAEKVRELETVRTDSIQEIVLFVPVVALVTHLRSPEGFDPHDVQWQSISADPTGSGRAQSYGLPPLIHLSALTRTDRWHTRYVNPQVYDELEWLYRLTRSSSLGPNRWWWNRGVREGMATVERTSHRELSNAEIAASTGDPVLRVLLALETTSFRYIPDEGGGVRLIAPTPQATTVSYLQPFYVASDVGLLRGAAARELRWCSQGGDIGYDPATCARLRRLAAHRFDFPYRGDYTLTVSYPRCQDRDRPVSYQFRFRY